MELRKILKIQRATKYTKDTELKHLTTSDFWVFFFQSKDGKGSGMS